MKPRLTLAPRTKPKPKPESEAKEPIAKTTTCDVKNDGDLLVRNWNGLLLPLIASPYDLSLTPVISGIDMAVNNPNDPQDIDCNEPEVDRGEYSESATNASILIDRSQPDLVVSPYRFQLYLFRSRLDRATRFVERHYPQHTWRLDLVEDNYRQLLQKFHLLSDRPILSTDLTVEFVFRYSAVTAHAESDPLPYCPGLTKSDIFWQRNILFIMRSQ
ncbi:hypothetical protein B0H13DRAFT_1901511 [Mycena leptocephala]|nr:hypothetical protein B0H13DRAFT_1901511 [Mycena leptocephala]